MRCRIALILLFSLVTSLAFADTSLIQKVSIEPLSGGISFNTITFKNGGYSGWVTAPSVEMRGRKEISILNTSTSSNVYITGVSGSTATRILYPREEIFLKASSDNHLYVSGSSVEPVIITEIR